jgi:hypothetical protein
MSQDSNTLIVLADLGKLRAFRSKHDTAGVEHLEEITLEIAIDAPVPLSEQVSDQAGRFPGGAESRAPGGMRHGESHGKTEEEQRRHIADLAEAIKDVVISQGCTVWRFAAPAAINNRIIARLPEAICERLLLNLHADLTKLPIADIEERLLMNAAPLG